MTKFGAILALATLAATAQGAGAGPVAVPRAGSALSVANTLGSDRTAPPAFRIPRDEWPLADTPAEREEGGGAEPDAGADVGPDADPTAPLPEIHYGDADLPEPVRAARAALVAAARSGDPEKVAALAGATTLSTLEGGDPLDLLVAQSGDPEGREILAILLDVLDAGWVEVKEGTEPARYVWPYFARIPTDRLTPPQMVELYRIITAGDFEEMRSAGAYVFYRVEFDADGTWRAFLAGE